MHKLIEFIILVFCIVTACGIIVWVVQRENKQTKRKQKNIESKSMVNRIVGGICAFIVLLVGLVTAFGSWGTIEAGNIGVVLRMGAVTGEMKPAVYPTAGIGKMGRQAAPDCWQRPDPVYQYVMSLAPSAK
jgi:hypothetical protein